MSPPLSRLSLFVSLSVSSRALTQRFGVPYAIPNYATLGSASWPSDSAWSSLNATCGGRLQALRPWAAVCYHDDPLYDPNACQTVLSNYKSDIAREAVASALLWPNWESCGYDDGCALNYSNPQPVSGETCYQGTTPPISIAISSAQDASNTIKWATANNVKLTIKNTGHDYFGRSSGPSSLQVLTHGLNSITYNAEFVPQGSSATPVPALILGAGAQLSSIYEFAGQQNVSAVLGACPTVGAAGGYFQGGGHGILTPTYGLAAERVLEVEIVTADGVIRTANLAQNSDLFWALRGGGPGSWGIVTSVTLATLPQIAISASLLVIAPKDPQNLQTLGVNFIALVGKYQNTFVNSGVTTSLVFSESEYILYVWWPADKASVSLLYPFFEELLGLSNDYTVASNKTEESMFPSVTTAEQENIGPFYDSTNSYGGSIHVASRFVSQSMLESSQSIQNVAEAIWEGYQIVSAPSKFAPAGIITPQTAVFLFGDMPASSKDQVNTTGANPGFFDAAWHVIFSAPWTTGISKSTYHSLTTAINNSVGPLDSLGLTSSYQNEGSTWEPNWQQAFFGSKYNDLLAIKQKYDPTNFFTTYKGVGSAPNWAAYTCYQSEQQV
ncbi:FAD-binding domain-containing protein [Imleria badia]|nr:FAD-binding domain-containing protein [Imleria badia]